MTEQAGRSSRELCLSLLSDILEKKRLLHIRLREVLDAHPELGPEDKAFISRAVRGCVEKLPLLDTWIAAVSSTPPEKMKPRIKNQLRLGTYQLAFMDVPDHAACGETVALTKPPQLKGFVNAVLRTLARTKPWEREEQEAGLLPPWLRERLIQWYGTEIAERIVNTPEAEGLNVRLLTARRPKSEILDMLAAEGIAAEKLSFADLSYRLTGVGDLRNVRAFQEGTFIVQDGGSALAVQCLAPKPGSLVLDVCAAPGGKSLAVADLLREGGRVISRDVSERKVALIRENAERCHAANILPEVWDATVPDPRFQGLADAVLVDAPCSGLGVFRKKPDLLLRLKEEDLDTLAALQRKILDTAASYVKPGGVLLYSTCTVNPAENAGNVKEFLEEHPAFRRDSIKSYLAGTPFAETEEGCLQLLPGVHGCDGFFLSRMVKASMP